MTMAHHPPPPHALLLEHAGWVRRLAHRLVRDEDAAEDLAQDALVRALERPPRVDRPVRGWLATVVRNLAVQGRRRGGRRRAREEDGARAEAVESSGEVVARAARQREVAAAVFALPEPLRTALLLRYFDERTPQEIAADLGVPVATVKARLARGRELLRERLERSHGGHARAWLIGVLTAGERASLAPGGASPAGAGAPASFHPLPLGALLVNAKILIAIAACALAGTLAVLVARRGGDGAGPAVAARPALAAAELRAAAELAAAAPEAGGARAAAPVERTPERATAGSAPGAAGASATPGAAIRGRVVDATSRAVAGVRVRRSGNEAGNEAGGSAGATGALTGPDGAFELSAGGGEPLVVDDARWVTVLAGAAVRASSGREAVVVVAPRSPLAGSVVEALGGMPVAGAEVRVVLPADFRADFALDLDYSIERGWSAISDADGRFALDTPWVAGARLTADAEGFRAHAEPLPPAGEHAVVLERAPLADRVLRGRVLDALGAAVDGALVAHGVDTTRTDRAGEFAFDLDAEASLNRRFQEMAVRFGEPPLSENTLIALAPGALPATYAAPLASDGRALWPGYVTLRLGAEPLALAGRVVGVDGAPVAGARVWVADPTFFGGVPGAAGGPDLVHAETLLRGGEPVTWDHVETDADGRFRIEGLLARPYRVEALHPETLLRAALDAVPAGRADLELEMPARAAYEVLSGIVVDRDGAPIPGVSVFPMCDAFRMRAGGAVVSTSHATAARVVTDAEGRFALAAVPRDLVYLRLEGPDVLPLEWGRHVEGGLASLVGERPEELVVRVARRCQFQVELDGRIEADELALLDPDGNALEISEFLGTGRREGRRQPLHAGRSNPMSASDAAATLVLYRAGEEVHRAPVRLVPGERVTLRP
jgi:RNA polymerase sigma-70 factor (ECF subfamily)